MIPEEEFFESRCEYAHFENFLITVFIGADRKLEYYEIVDYSSFRKINDPPAYIVDGIKSWAKTEFKHTMFLQHYLMKLFGTCPK